MHDNLKTQVETSTPPKLLCLDWSFSSLFLQVNLFNDMHTGDEQLRSRLFLVRKILCGGFERLEYGVLMSSFRIRVIDDCCWIYRIFGGKTCDSPLKGLGFLELLSQVLDRLL